MDVSKINDINTFIESLEPINNINDRRAIIILYLTNSPNSPFYINIRTGRNKLDEIIPYSENPKFEKYKYQILTVLLDEIKRAKGVIGEKVVLQLASDFTSRDIHTITNYLYKPILTSDKITKLLLLYKEVFDDDYFDNSLGHTRLIYTNKIVNIIATDKNFNEYYYLDENSTLKSVKLNLKNNVLKKQLKYLILNNFVVATKQNKNNIFKKIKVPNVIRFINKDLKTSNVVVEVVDNCIIELK